MGATYIEMRAGVRVQVEMHIQDNFLFVKGGNAVFITYHVKVELGKIISLVKNLHKKSSFCLFKAGGK